MTNPFTSLTCSIRYDGARVLMWTLLQGATYPYDFTLQVENSRVGGPWTVIATGLRDVCLYEDTRARNYNKYVNEAYRVRLTSVWAGDDILSPVCEAGIMSVYPFSAEAANVIRQTSVGIRVSGCTGVLLKRKHWGPRCPDCTDFDGQSPVNEHCPRCFGVGIDGGYYNGISLDLIKDVTQSNEGDSALGYMQGETLQGRCIAYPWIAPGDIWCEEYTNKRYVISGTNVAAAHKHVPLIFTLVMHRAELTDAVYTPPITDKVIDKDVWVDGTPYTPVTAEAYEQELRSRWDNDLETP